MRNDIVSIHVSCEIEDSFKDFVEYWPDLSLFTVLQHTLDNSAAKLMNTHLVYTGFEGFHNELYLLRDDLFNNFLNNMIAVCILNAVNDSGLDLFNNLILYGRWKNFKGFLNDSATVLVARELKNPSLEIEKEHFPLVGGAKFKHLLDDIVAKNIFH
jgi:hypothetical protein